MQQVLIDLQLFLIRSNITAPFNKLSQDIIIRAVSPFSVSDEATREAINKKYGTTTSQETMRNVGIVGGIVGATAATAATVLLAGTKLLQQVLN